MKRGLRPSAFGLRGASFLIGLSLFAAPASAAVFHPESYKLSNGLEIVIVRGALAPIATHMLWYKVGAADDPAGQSGLAHYLEHLMFKATANMPAGAFSATIAALGGQDNAFTDHDATAFYVTIPAKQLPLVMAMEAERMHRLALTPAEALPEREVVLNERHQRTDNSPQGLFSEELAAALFPNHPYGRPVIGWREDIEKLTASEAQAHNERFYAPNNAILVVSGDVDPQKVLSLAAATFGQIPAGPESHRATIKMPPLPSKRFVERRDVRVTQPFIVRQILAPSAREDARRSIALEVLEEALGGGEVGLLYRAFVIEKRQAVAADVSYEPTRRGPSVFSFSFVPTPQGDARKLEKDADAWLHALARRGLSANEVEAAKKRLEDGAIFARDSASAPASILGEALAAGEPIAAVEEWPEHLRGVTDQDVTQALRALLASPRQVRGLLSPPLDKEKTP